MENVMNYYEVVETDAVRQDAQMAAAQNYDGDDAVEGTGGERRDMFKGGAWFLPRLL